LKKTKSTFDKKSPGPAISRRGLLQALAAAGALAPLGQAAAQFRGPEVPERPTFFFTQLMYGADLSWNPHPTAARSLMEVLASRTSIAAAADRVDLTLADPRLFRYPFLYWTGTREFPELPRAGLDRLKLFLESGGTLLADDALCAQGVGFDKAFTREVARMFPGEGLTKLPQDHTVFRSFYLIDKAAGRTATKPFLTGIDRGSRTVLIYSSNDLGGAWARDASGRFVNPVNPGGEMQREMAVRLGINVLMYALCLNYKQDLIHTPFISERRKGARPPR
jgi:hypothetical protein